MPLRLPLLLLPHLGVLGLGSGSVPATHPVQRFRSWQHDNLSPCALSVLKPVDKLSLYIHFWW